jgi:RNA polymerase sigma-70 factor, ECF subfamily
MDSSPSFRDLKKRLASGDPSAPEELVNKFARRLVALARTRLNSRLRAKMDPEDVVQSVWKSFFWRQEHGDFELHNWSSLWGLLAAITLRKCGHQVDYFSAARRNIDRERSPRASAESSASFEAFAREPTPAEVAVVVDTLEQAMRGLEDYHRDILQLRLQGYSVAEISDQVGYTERTVHRVLERVRHRLERLEAAAE